MTGQEIINWIVEHNEENEDMYYDSDGNITTVDEIDYWYGSMYDKLEKPIIVIG